MDHHNYYADKAEAFADVYRQVTAANPNLVRFCLVAPPAAGGEVAGAYRRFVGRLPELLLEGRPKRAKRPAPATEFGIVGGWRR